MTDMRTDQWRSLLWVTLIALASTVVMCSPTEQNSDLVSVVNELRVQVELLQKARAEDRDAITRLRERVDFSGTTTASSDEAVSSRTLRALEQERSSLSLLDVQLRRLKQDLSELASAKEREVRVTGEVADLRLESESLRAELRRLRQEMEAGRSRRDQDLASLGQLRVQQATTKWLQKTVEELRSELTELGSALNVSLALRQRQRFESAVELLRRDFVSMRSEFEAVRALHQRDAAAVSQLQQEVAELRTLNQRLNVDHQHLVEQVTAVQEDIDSRRTRSSGNSLQSNLESSMELSTSNSKVLDPHKEALQNDETLTDDSSGDGDLTNIHFYQPEEYHPHRLRHHHRRLKLEVTQLHELMDIMQGQQTKLEREVDRLRQNYTSLKVSQHNTDHTTMVLTNQTRDLRSEQDRLTRRINQLEDRLDTVEEEVKHNVEGLRNASGAMGGIEKLHTSTVQLFEALESMEDDYGKNIDELQKEVSKFEFNVAQIQSSFEVMREDQSSHYESLKSVKKDLSVLDLQVQRDHYRLAMLQNEVLNRSVQECKNKNEDVIRDLKLSDLELRIVRIGKKFSESDNRLDYLAAQLKSKTDTSTVRRWEENNQALQETIANLTDQLPLMQSHSLTAEREILKFVRRLPTDCSMAEAVRLPAKYRSGTYLIRPMGMSQSLEVFCNMEEPGGPWTLVQRRMDGSQDFYHDWNAYKQGFGDPSGEYWLGNDALYQMTHTKNYTLRVSLWDTFGRYSYAEYNTFYVGDEPDNYRLTVHGYSGNASNALEYHNGMAFSTRDRDNDASSTHCAVYYSSGWWYNHCQYVNINGKYNIGLTWYDIDNHEWVQLNRVEMKLRPRYPGHS